MMPLSRCLMAILMQDFREICHALYMLYRGSQYTSSGSWLHSALACWSLIPLNADEGAKQKNSIWKKIRNRLSSENVPSDANSPTKVISSSPTKIAALHCSPDEHIAGLSAGERPHLASKIVLHATKASNSTIYCEGSKSMLFPVRSS